MLPNSPRVLVSEMWPIEKIRPNTWNPNVMDDKTYELTKLSMIEEGFSDPIDIDPTGQILDGEHRYRAAIELGLTEVPVFVKERYGDDAVITTIRKDRTHGEPDLVKLSEIVGDLVDEMGSAEVERRLGYDESEQQAFSEVNSWDWGAYGTDEEDAEDRGSEEYVTWSVGVDADTRSRLESLLDSFSASARVTELGDTDVGRFVALMASARTKGGVADSVIASEDEPEDENEDDE